MFQVLRRTMNATTFLYVHFFAALLIAIIGFWVSLELFQFSSGLSPVTYEGVDIFTLGACCMFIMGVYSLYDAIQTFDNIRTGY